MARWPDIARSVGGLECAYYRANGRVPDVVFSGNRNPGGELVLVEGGEREEDVVGDEVKGGSGSSDGEDEKGREEGEDEGEGKEVYKVYKGVAYRTRGVKCRKARISLLERFPEELVDERNEWVRAEHRVAARDAGEFHLPIFLVYFFLLRGRYRLSCPRRMGLYWVLEKGC